MNKDPNTYPPPSDICDAKTAKHLPPYLFRFINWLLDKEAYKSANTFSDKHDTIGECVAKCITANSKCIDSTKVGGVVKHHNECGTKTLIETLNAHAYCVMRQGGLLQV